MIEYVCPCGKVSLFFEALHEKEGFCPSCKVRITLHSTPLLRQRTKNCESCSQVIAFSSEQCLYCQQRCFQKQEKTLLGMWLKWKKSF